jgi:hypothetical protein
MNRKRSMLLTFLILGSMSVVLSIHGFDLSAATPIAGFQDQSPPCLIDGHWGMMQGWGQMGPGMMQGAMMGGSSDSSSMWSMMGNAGIMSWHGATDQPIGLSDASASLGSFALTCGFGLTIGKVLAFDDSFYAVLLDASNDAVGEVLLDRYSGSVYPEPGPNMMWNANWGAGGASATTPVYDLAAAQALATTFLASYLPGATVLDGRALPGYASFEVGTETPKAVLSVNFSTGEVWVHTWLGPALNAA